MKKFTKEEIQGIARMANIDPLKSLEALGGYYSCPYDGLGNRKGPIVGYAGKYDDGKGQKLQYVGDTYANFSVIEQYPEVLGYMAEKLRLKTSHVLNHETVDLVCGPQMGGIAIGYAFAERLKVRFAYIEKKIIQLASENAREQSELCFLKHQIHEGERVVICEDVLNNFSTTEQTIEVINSLGGIVVGIVGLMNRSVDQKKQFPVEGADIPIIALVEKPIHEYRQDDPAVDQEIKNKNVIWKPKNEWGRLMDAMSKKTT